MRFAPFAAVVLLTACSTPDTRQAQNQTASVTTADTATAAEPLDTARAANVNAQSDTLQVVRRRHVFSNAAAPDVFTLTVRGPSLLSGEATFTIADDAGQVIFREVLTAADLEAALIYEMKGNTASQAEREAFVRRRLNKFFAPQNFARPALPTSETYRPGATDRATWDDLRRRPDAVSFRYLVGKEDRRRIVWSPLTKQVVKLPGLGS